MLSPLLWIMLCSLGVLALASVRRIPEGQVYSLRRVGGQTRLVGAGMHFLLPLIERVSHKISLTGSTLPLAGALASGVPYRGMVYFQVLDPARAEIVIESVDSLLHDRATALLADGASPVDNGDLRGWLKSALNSEIRDRGLFVTRVDLRTGE
ncbi:MAG: hypothetical protein ABI650_05885 [Dokdonella sp.]